MFSLKSDFYFLSIEMAKEIAWKFNKRLRIPSVSTVDPREARRIGLELEAARERARASAIAHRNGFL
jgi:hypothetical protein